MRPATSLITKLQEQNSKTHLETVFAHGSVSGGAITFGSAPPANNGTDSAHIIAVIHNLHKLGE